MTARGRADQRPLGDALVRMGVITSGELDAMLRVQRRDGRPLSKQLVESGVMTEERLVAMMGEQLGIETVDLTEVWVHERVRDLVAPDVAHPYAVLPLARRRVGTSEALLLAMADPLDDEAVATVVRGLPDGMAVVRLLAGEADLLRAIGIVYGPREAVDEARAPVDDLWLESTAGFAAPEPTDDEGAGIGPEPTLEDVDATTEGALPPGLDPFGAPPTADEIEPDSLQPTEADVPAVPSGPVAVPSPPRQEGSEPGIPTRIGPPLVQPTEPEEDSLPMVTPVVGPPTPSGGTRGPPTSRPPGGPARSRAPATEVIRTRTGAPNAVEVRDARPREALVDLSIGGPRASARVVAQREDERDAERFDVVSTRSVVRVVEGVPRLRLGIAAAAGVALLGGAVWAVFGPSESVPMPGRADGTALVDEAPIADLPTSPDPPLAPLKPPSAKLGRFEIAPGIHDGPPPPGHQYVLLDGLELRATASVDAEPLLWLKAGQLIRPLEMFGETALVLVPPEGPAGFVARAHLGEQLPMSALARRLRFDRCAVPAGGILDDCRYGARTQWEDCRFACRPGTRCEAACETAFEACLTACRVSKPTEPRGRGR